MAEAKADCNSEMRLPCRHSGGDGPQQAQGRAFAGIWLHAGL